jgi:hypothetical protein
VNLQPLSAVHHTRTAAPAAAQASAPRFEAINTYFREDCDVVTSLQVQDVQKASVNAVACCASEVIGSADQVLPSMSANKLAICVLKPRPLLY